MIAPSSSQSVDGYDTDGDLVQTHTFTMATAPDVFKTPATPEAANGQSGVLFFLVGVAFIGVALALINPRAMLAVGILFTVCALLQANVKK